MSQEGYVRPVLSEVTLVAATSVALGATVAALEASMRQAEFGDVLLLSDVSPPPETNPAISWRWIEHLGSRVDYSRFMLRGLADHIRTSHALCVQWDGFVLNGQRWNRRFLDFDYIGAVWPQFADGHNVGNGGFSLRSRRLLEACRELPFDGQLEDLVIGRLCRNRLEEDGMHFAPESVARTFSFERSTRTGKEFGFHGVYNLVRLLSGKEVLQTFRSLEPQVLGRKELSELLRWALKRGRLKLALEVAKRIIRRLTAERRRLTDGATGKSGI